MSNPTTILDFQIATALEGVAGLVTLRSLGISNPRPVYKTGVTAVDLGDNSSRILGAPQVAWAWGFISQVQRDALREYCPGASADVLIVTPTTEKILTEENAAQTFSAKMLWPAPLTPENPIAGRRLEFVLIFRQLELYVAP